MSKPLSTMFAIGCLLSTGAPFIGRFVAVPDFLSGFLAGLGIAIMILVLIRHKREKSFCITSVGDTE